MVVPLGVGVTFYGVDHTDSQKCGIRLPAEMSVILLSILVPLMGPLYYSSGHGQERSQGIAVQLAYCR